MVERMPVLFCGHGSPMNALQDNPYTRCWQQLGQRLPKPAAILAISAHWVTEQLSVTAMQSPRTIHDFGHFPQALFDVQYPAPGSPELAEKVARLLRPNTVSLDQHWGLDHGSWGVLLKMYPEADIPVVQLGLNRQFSVRDFFEMGQKLQALRQQQVLIVASGNTVHNLQQLRTGSNAQAWPWATEFDRYVQQHLKWTASASQQPLIHFQQHPAAQLAHPSIEHFLPLIALLGTLHEEDTLSLPITGIEMGGLGMLTLLAQ